MLTSVLTCWLTFQTVTYKTASKELGVHVNTAKQMLFALSVDVSTVVDVLYLVAGRNEDGRLTVKVTSNRDDHGLASVASKHVYAIAPKGNANSRYIRFGPKHSSIQCINRHFSCEIDFSAKVVVCQIQSDQIIWDTPY